MATKRLSRSLTEGGRTSGDKFDRKEDIRRNRREGKAMCHSALTDIDIGLLDDEIPDVCMPTETRIHNHGGRPGYWGPCRDHKSAPLTRFLESYVGQAWNKVYSELTKRFDERTISSALVWVDGAGDQEGQPIDPNAVSYWRRGGLYVDDRGTLKRYKSRPKDNREYTTEAERNRMPDFLGKRKIMRNGGIFCWVEPCNPLKAIKAYLPKYPRYPWAKSLHWSYTERVWTEVKPKDVKECHHFGGETVGSASISSFSDMTLRERREARRQADGGYWITRQVGAKKYRAGKELTGREMADWNKFSQSAQDEMIKASGWTKTTSRCKFCEEEYEHYSRFCDACDRWQ